MRHSKNTLRERSSIRARSRSDRLLSLKEDRSVLLPSRESDHFPADKETLVFGQITWWSMLDKHLGRIFHPYNDTFYFPAHKEGKTYYML